MAVNVTNTTIAALNTAEYTVTANAATSTAANGTEVFTITPTKAGAKMAIIFQNANSHGAYTYSMSAGETWGGKAVTGSIAQNAMEVLQFDSARVMQSSGTILLTLTPATGKILLGNHAAKVYVIETL